MLGGTIQLTHEHRPPQSSIHGHGIDEFQCSETLAVSAFESKNVAAVAAHSRVANEHKAMATHNVSGNTNIKQSSIIDYNSQDQNSAGLFFSAAVSGAMAKANGHLHALHQELKEEVQDPFHSHMSMPNEKPHTSHNNNHNNKTDQSADVNITTQGEKLEHRSAGSAGKTDAQYPNGHHHPTHNSAHTAADMHIHTKTATHEQGKSEHHSFNDNGLEEAEKQAHGCRDDSMHETFHTNGDHHANGEYSYEANDGANMSSNETSRRRRAVSIDHALMRQSDITRDRDDREKEKWTAAEEDPDDYQYDFSFGFDNSQMGLQQQMQQQQEQSATSGANGDGNKALSSGEEGTKTHGTGHDNSKKGQTMDTNDDAGSVMEVEMETGNQASQQNLQQQQQLPAAPSSSSVSQQDAEAAALSEKQLAYTEQMNHLLSNQDTQLICSLKTILDFESETDMQMIEWMFKREKDYQPDPDYMEYQTRIEPNMRSILFDWMMEVSQEFSLGREAMYLAINYVDRYLARINILIRTREQQKQQVQAAKDNGDTSDAALALAHALAQYPEREGLIHNGREYFSIVTRANLQLLGVTCLFIASKLEEIFPPNSSDFAVTTDGAYTTAQIDLMEKEVLKLLEWELHPQTTFSWLKVFVRRAAQHVNDQYDMYIQQHNNDPNSDPRNEAAIRSHYEKILTVVMSVRHFTRCMELLDMCILDVYFLRFFPSALAASAMFVVMPELHQWHKQITGYDASALSACINFLHHFSTHLRHLGIRPPAKPYFELKIPPEDMYTRQSHHPDALQLLSDLVKMA